MTKIRADKLVLNHHLAQTKEEAARLIMAGKVALVPPTKVDTYKKEDLISVTKAGNTYPEDSLFCLIGQEPYVSRGAYKLLTAMSYFSLNVLDYTCLDAGASTGGFTDCLLQHGAKKVYAIDVGTAQLHEKLKNDSRVISHENTNLRSADISLIKEKIDLIVIDVSFISLTLIIPPCLRWLKDGGIIIALIKPQFEVSSNQTVKGIVRDETIRKNAIDKILLFCEKELNLTYKGIVPSAIKGPKGNQEYLACWIQETHKKDKTIS